MVIVQEQNERTTKVLPIAGLDVGVIGSSSLFCFCSGWRLVIWLFVLTSTFKSKPGSGCPGGRNSIPPPSAILNVERHFAETL